jgi:hypothetical protein
VDSHLSSAGVYVWVGVGVGVGDVRMEINSIGGSLQCYCVRKFVSANNMP